MPQATTGVIMPVAEPFFAKSDARPTNLIPRKSPESGIVESSVKWDESEKAALIELFYATGGTGWKKSGRWIVNPDITTWSGVVVSTDGRVTKLILNDNGLKGKLPDIFSSLPFLKVLYLSGNELVVRNVDSVSL